MGSDGAEPPVFSIDVAARDDGRTTVAVAGELDLATLGEFERAVTGALASGGVVLDLRELSFMDSGGVRALNGALREAARRGHDLAVCDGLQAGVVQVLEMTGMLALLPVEERR